jgi:hypothetical protein
MVSEATSSCGSKVAARCVKLGGSHVCHYVKEIHEWNIWQVVCISVKLLASILAEDHSREPKQVIIARFIADLE